MSSRLKGGLRSDGPSASSPKKRSKGRAGALRLLEEGRGPSKAVMPTSEESGTNFLQMDATDWLLLSFAVLHMAVMFLVLWALGLTLFWR
jgi:hypothetical protein